MVISDDVKKIYVENPVAIATVMPDGRPNVIGVAFVKVVEGKILVTDNFMSQTITDILHDNHITAIAWDGKMNGFKCIGTAEYFTSGHWVDMVKEIPENKGMPSKGALVITVENIITTA